MQTKEQYSPVVLVNPAFNPGIKSIDVLYDRPVVVCIKDLPQCDLPKESFNVYIEGGEPSVHCEPLANVKARKDLDLILTKRPELLENAPCRSVLFPFGSCWTKNTKEKEFGVSFLITSPRGLDGYELRHRLWSQKDRISIPKRFYNSSRRPCVNIDDAPKIDGASKDPLFDVMFSICIENTREPYYFTEKIVDALQSKTVPIYYGCTNIGKFFDLDGIIVVDDEDEIVNVCNSLTADDYEKRKEAIQNNYEASKEYAGDFPQRMFNTIKDCMKGSA